MASGEQDEAAQREPRLSFAALMDRLQAGDEGAAREIHRRYTRGLIALARQRLSTTILGKVDPESVVQSVYASFFQRQHKGEFPALGDWDDLWALLTVITLRKCLNRTRYHRQACRDVERAVGTGPEADSGDRWQLADPEPTPLEAAILTETLEQLLGSLQRRERQIIELLLQGYALEEVRKEVGCGERTVRRVRDRVRQKLRQMQQAE